MKWVVPALAALLALGGCFRSDTVHDETLVGPYRLHAIDTMETMAILWEVPEGGLAGDGLPGPTVFAAGHNDRYLVAAVHPPVCRDLNPECSDFGMRRDVTEYWYVIRAPSERERIPYNGIKGPLRADQFAAEKARLGLPDFSTRFAELQ
jgi:hypothetical protein